MGVPEIILIIACAAIVIGSVVANIIRKKQGKTSCGCDCNICGGGCKSCKNDKHGEK